MLKMRLEVNDKITTGAAQAALFLKKED